MIVATRIAFLAAALFCALCRSAAAVGAPVDVSALSQFTCPDDQGLVDRKIIRYCGHVAIPGGKLAVVVLIPPVPEKAKRTPTVFVHGGPGFGVVDGWATIGALRFAADAPLVIFDQRSTGLSEPKLCEFLDTDDPKLDAFTPEALHELALRDIKRCTAELRDGSVDLSAYGTLGTVRDMEHLREALRVEKWNVYGISYGTTVTLAYLAAHSDRVRAAIIDSVYPPEMRAFSNIVPDFFSALDGLNRACASQPRCKQRFGDIRVALDRAIAELDKAPLPLRVVDPATFVEGDRILSSTGLLAAVQSKLMQSTTWHIIPRLLADAGDRNASYLLSSVFADALYEGSVADNAAYLATECRERAPFDDSRALSRQSAQWPAVARVASIRTIFETCAVWPSKQTSSWSTPANVAPPVLVTAGEWDPVTPAEHARRTAATLGPHAQFLLVPKAAHSVTTGDACIEQIVADFFAEPEKAIDATCVSGRSAPTFATRLIAYDSNIVSDPGRVPASSFVFLLGLLSSVLWPAALLIGRTPSQAPVSRRSALWLTVSSLGVVAWATPLALAVRQSQSSVWTWSFYGIPAESWPFFPAIVLFGVTTVAAAWTLGREWRTDALSLWPLLHRTFVLVSLAAVFFSLWRVGVLTQAPSHAIEEMQMLLGF